MPKEAMKQRLSAEQGNVCALSGEPLPSIPALMDTDREDPKANGGTYTDDNTRIVDPVAHMKRHGNYREREEQLDRLKATFDDRVQTMKLLLKVNNQLRAYERRTDNRHPETEAWLEEQTAPFKERMKAIEKSLKAQIGEYDDPVSQAALSVPGIGFLTVAALAVYVELDGVYPELDGDGKPHPRAGQEKASTPSSLWAYVGLDKASHERYEKGKKGGGNKTLRTVLWNTANSIMKSTDNPYRLIYDRTKERLAISEKTVKTRNTKGVLVELAWKDTKPSHRHGAALRAIAKHLLVDYWLVGRALLGLPTRTIYAEGMLGHSHIESPQDHGWPEV